MYRVLLVDDETLDLEGLKRLVPWTELGMEVVSSVNSGFEALDILKRESVDILLTDIRMPIMSGIELSEKAKGIKKDIKVIFISGHSDFQYAKKAVQINANGYILKPIDDDELINVLKEVSEVLDKEREISLLKKSVDETMPYLKNEFFLDLLRGTCNLKNIITYMEKNIINLSGDKICAVVIEIDDLGRKLSQIPEVQHASFTRRLLDEIIYKLEKGGMGNYCRSEQNRLTVILDKAFNEAKKLSEKLRTQIYEDLQISVTVSLGEEVSNIFEINKSYESAIAVLNNKMFIGKGKVITGEETKREINPDMFQLDEKIEDLFNTLVQKEPAEITAHLDDIGVLLGGMKSKILVYNFFINFFYKLTSFLQSQNENLKSVLGSDFQYADILLNFETTDDILGWIKNVFLEISRYLQLKQKNKNSKLVLEMQKFICENLEKNLTLSNLADYFEFSPNYLGHIYKEETGENFSDFLVRKRMEKARELLKNPRRKVFEVADMVGYTNITHFCRRFRETFGVTPGNYRKQV